MQEEVLNLVVNYYMYLFQIVEENLDISLILEDDIHFVPYFRYRFLEIMEEIKKLDWDLV